VFMSKFNNEVLCDEIKRVSGVVVAYWPFMCPPSRLCMQGDRAEHLRHSSKKAGEESSLAWILPSHLMCVVRLSSCRPVVCPSRNCQDDSHGCIHCMRRQCYLDCALNPSPMANTARFAIKHYLFIKLVDVLPRPRLQTSVFPEISCLKHLLLTPWIQTTQRY
jgi:hypothetical protein